MSRVKFVPLLSSLLLSLLVGVSGVSPSSEPLGYQISGADAEESAPETEHSADSSARLGPIKLIAKRRTDTFAPTTTILSPVMLICDQALGHFCHSSAATICQAAPLYQSLRVYRL